MRTIVSYDITDDRIRRRIDKVCKGFGQRVQRSVFECSLTHDQLKDLINRLEATRKEKGSSPTDSIRLYPVCAECAKAVIVLGHQPVIVTETGSAVIG